MIAVRPMTSDDIGPTAVLLQEMQAHYRAVCPALDEIVSRLRTLPEGVTILTATDPGVIGLAAIGRIFPGPGLVPGLFLKDLFVSSRARGQGVGTELMRATARLAVEGGFGRIDWTADKRNERLLAFYTSVGATEQEKVFLRLAGQALTDLAADRIRDSFTT